MHTTGHGPNNYTVLYESLASPFIYSVIYQGNNAFVLLEMIMPVTFRVEANTKTRSGKRNKEKVNTKACAPVYPQTFDLIFTAS